ncbi:methyltransferase family protein [Stackebrandtia albiflava]|uniref:Methyltransferase family protein n=1 Tax=Stackebrandtia albiflava TaxID=406432 RepID=A0A562V131_9ACTN|nr:class I SAM-dependent methyltransferase [Stackebrandtia albiflava]TWJ11574.1 methyltransferase family protein [Stackebrandtia albiflava]
MTDIPAPAYGTRLDFASPLSGERATALVTRLAAATPRTILDIGCGWGELLLRLVESCPGATGTGIDTDEPDVLRGRRNADARGLGDRTEFVVGPGEDHDTPADLVLCIGASHAYGDTPSALRRLRELVTPGGTLLFADVFWERPPTEADLANLWPDTTPDDHPSLHGLVGHAEAAGFQPLWIESVNRDEWERFESGHLADKAEWLLRHGDDPRAEGYRTDLADHRRIWLTGSRDLVGFAYLTLGVPA